MKNVLVSQATTDGKRPPIIAFFGTKGGVGKTTIVDKFSTLVSRTQIRPNVLMVDFDIHHRGLTVLRTKDRFGNCPTIHEYLANDKLEFQGAQDVTPAGNSNPQGRELLIPSSGLTAEHVFKALTTLKSEDLVERLDYLLTAAVKRYNIDLILVDCGPIVDPLTASAAFMADMAFIIGQNEPITFQSLQNYATRIREFMPEFDASKVRVILNKVRGQILQRASIYAAIPFTMEVVDYSEGLENIDEIRLIYLDYCVHGIIKSTFSSFGGKYSNLTPGPEAILTPHQRRIVDSIDDFKSSKWYPSLRRKSALLGVGAVMLLLAAVVWLVPPFFKGPNFSAADHPYLVWAETYLPTVLLILGLVCAFLGTHFYRRLRRVNRFIELKRREGYEGLLELLNTRDGRQRFDEIRVFSEKTEKEKIK